MERVLIRRAVAADVEAVRRLEEQWAAENITYGFAPDDEGQIKRRLGPYFLIAEIEGQTVGFVSGTPRTSAGLAVVSEGTLFLEIENLYVVPQFRRMGVGGLLLERLLEAARQDGLRKVTIYSASQEIRRILSFYEAHGFQSWYVQMFRDL